MILKEFTLDDFNELYSFMEPLWLDTYEKIIGKKQVYFLLDKYFRLENINNFRKNNYQYYIIFDDNEKKGVVVYCVYDDYLYLDKIYLLPSERGKGYAKLVFDKLIKIKSKIILNVNQANSRAIKCYKKNGFTILKEENIKLEDGMVNIDYKMIKEEL